MFLRTVARFNCGIKSVAILGGGIMGSGIATSIVTGNKRAIIVDIDDARVAVAKKAFEKSLAWQCKKKSAFLNRDVDLETCLSLCTFTTDRDAAVKDVDLVIEAVPEMLSLKVDVLKSVEANARKDAIIVSNTSSLAIGDMSAPLSRQNLFAGLHYFSPVERMGLIEVVKGPQTDPAVIERLVSFSKECGKSPVVCKDTPGFAVNRLLVPYLLEACRMVERGDVGMEDVDTAMRLGAGHPMGPFRLADMVGLDTLKHIIDGWHAKFPENPAFLPSPLIDEKVAQGKLGAKTKEGFFKW